MVYMLLQFTCNFNQWLQVTIEVQVFTFDCITMVCIASHLYSHVCLHVYYYGYAAIFTYPYAFVYWLASYFVWLLPH